jgi:hypothetical protein
LHFALRDIQLGTEDGVRQFHLGADPFKRHVQARASLDAQDEHIQRIRQSIAQAALTLALVIIDVQDAAHRITPGYKTERYRQEDHGSASSSNTSTSQNLAGQRVGLFIKPLARTEGDVKQGAGLSSGQ